jgi:hypothetical protein
MMTHVAHSPVLDNNVGLISQQAETKTTSDADILDIFTGEQTDLKKVRIKIGDAEEQAIRLLLEHYSKTLGRDVTLSQLVALLVNKSLTDSLNIDFSFMSKALEAGFRVDIPQISLPKIGGSL